MAGNVKLLEPFDMIGISPGCGLLKPVRSFDMVGPLEPVKST